MLAILIMVEKFRTGKRCMRIRISDQEIDDLGMLSSGSVAGWGGWRARQRLSRLYSPLSASVGWWCTWFFASPACLRFVCGAFLARKAARCLGLTKHSWLSLYLSLHIVMPRKLNTPLLPFSDLGVWFLIEIFRCLHCGARTAFFCQFRHIQRRAHVGMFQLYPTSLPCHSRSPVETLQDISCCFWQWNLAFISTIYASVDSSNVIKACFFHSRGCSLENSSGTIPGMTTSWCWICQTVGTNALVDQGGLPIKPAINLLCSSLRTLAAHYMVNQPPFASIWMYSHPAACCFWFLPLPVWRTIFKFASWVIWLVAALAASLWTNLGPGCCCVPRIEVFDVVPAKLPIFDALSPGGGDCVCMMWWCGLEDEDDNERKWEALRTI